MDILYNIFYFGLALAILVTIHEWGHFIAAKITGMRSDIFSFGMGRRLLGWNEKTGFTFGRLPDEHVYEGKTDWRISLFPIGGYVKIVGMVDESFDTDYGNTEIQDYEFRAKNTFQKLLVISAGVIMNFVLAIAIFSYLTYSKGSLEQLTNKISYIHSDSFLTDYDIEPGDNIININGTEIKSWREILKNIVFVDLGNDKNITIKRNNKTHKVIIKGENISQFLNKRAKSEEQGNFLGLDSDFLNVIITSVVLASPAQKIGIQTGDTIMYLDNQKVVSSQQFISIIKNSSRKLVDITWKRNNKIYNSSIQTNKDNVIGVGLFGLFTGPILTTKYGLTQSVEMGINETLSQLSMILNSFGEIFKGNIEFKNAVGGPIKIMEQSGKTAEMGMTSFMSFVAMLSISLALINILPIPALDGGHLVIILIEGIKRKELNLKSKLIIQNIGFYLLIILMIIILYIDMARYL